MYTATPLSKHGQYASHICDCRWPPAHTQHSTTNNNDIDEIDDHNNKEQQEQYHNHHNHHQQPWYHHRQLDNGQNDAGAVAALAAATIFLCSEDSFKQAFACFRTRPLECGLQILLQPGPAQRYARCWLRFVGNSTVRSSRRVRQGCPCILLHCPKS